MNPWKVASTPQVVYAKTPLPKVMRQGIFLAGPTPRDKSVPSWRPEALRLLAERGYSGHVFVPEPSDGVWTGNYIDQVDWEESALNQSDCILFWIPRDMQTMPALTTNDEWGTWKFSGKAVLGTPPNAPHVKYQRHYAAKLGVRVADTLAEAVDLAVAKVGNGAERTGGECQVPLHVWNRPDFQQWLRAQRGAGNRLDGARLMWAFFVGPNRDRLFLYTLHVNVYIASENRNKINEVVLYRPDISTVVLIRPATNPLDSEVVLVREFRSPASTPDGMVHEVPGGSSAKPGEDPVEVAVHEVSEETGLTLDPSRLVPLGARQLTSTLSAHKASVWCACLTASEMDEVRAMVVANVTHGVVQDTERTYLEIRTVRQILGGTRDVDWSMVGMILQAITRST